MDSFTLIPLFIIAALVAALALYAVYGPAIHARWQAVDHKEREMRIREMRERAKAAGDFATAQSRLYKLTAGSFPAGNYVEGWRDDYGRVISLTPPAPIEFPMLQTKHDSYSYRNDVQGGAPAPFQVLPARPKKLDLKDYLEEMIPGRALLAFTEEGEPIYTDLPGLMHPALAGATGGGKSNIERLLLSNMIHGRVMCLLGDPHFAPVDPKTGEDWRPLASRLWHPPVVDPVEIAQVARWLASVVIPQRLADRREGRTWDRSICLFVDELPSVVKHAPGFFDHIADILREGRKVDVFCSLAAQDFLSKTIGAPGAIRDCLRTAYYVGGDATTARVLLDLPPGRQIDESALGQAGAAMLRSKATPQAQKVRVPLVSNESLYELFGPPLNRPASPWPDTASPWRLDLADTTPDTGLSNLDRARKAWRPGIKIRELQRTAGVPYSAARQACKEHGEGDD